MGQGLGVLPEGEPFMLFSGLFPKEVTWLLPSDFTLTGNINLPIKMSDYVWLFGATGGFALKLTQARTATGQEAF